MNIDQQFVVVQDVQQEKPVSPWQSAPGANRLRRYRSADTGAEGE
jgi:hypothetical protein